MRESDSNGNTETVASVILTFELLPRNRQFFSNFLKLAFVPRRLRLVDRWLSRGFNELGPQHGFYNSPCNDVLWKVFWSFTFCFQFADHGIFYRMRNAFLDIVYHGR